MQTLEWFKARQGKRIFRDDNFCPCQTCQEVTRNGLIVGSEGHAEYLYDTQMDYAAEGFLLNYRDTQ